MEEESQLVFNLLPPANKTFARRKRKRDKDFRKPEEQATLRKFSFFRDDRDREIAGYEYRKMHVVDIPILSEGRAVRLLRLMGLYSFATQSVPSLDKRICDEFLSSFDPKTSTGTVRGTAVKLDEGSVSGATNLPVGTEDIPTIFTAQHRSSLKRILMKPSEKKCRGYDLGQVVYGEDVDVFAAVASMLMVRLESKKDCFNCVSAEVLLGLDKSYQREIEMNWAGYLAKIMSKSAKHCRFRHRLFPHGEWLTKIIYCSLVEVVDKGIQVDIHEDVNVQEQGCMLEDDWRYQVEQEKKMRIELEMKLQKLEEDNVGLKVENEKLQEVFERREQEMVKYRRDAVEMITLVKSAYNKLKKENTALKNALSNCC